MEENNLNIKIITTELKEGNSKDILSILNDVWISTIKILGEKKSEKNKIFLKEIYLKLKNVENIFDENKDNKKNIKDFLNYSVGELFEKIKNNFRNKEEENNIIGEKFFLYFLVKNEEGKTDKNGLIEFDKNFNVSYNVSNEKFKEFLSLSKNLLELIEKIYKGGEEAEELEKSLLKDIDYFTKPIIDGIYNKITK